MERVKEITNYNGALQVPVNSGFDNNSTANEVIKGIDLSGTTAVITGGYTGIGLETVKTMASAGAEVIVPARNVEKAKKNLEGLKNVSVESMDLMNPVSIDSFAEKFLEEKNALHFLINNAGIMWVPLMRDSRGNESQLSTNHLGHFQLTARLWPALRSTGNTRVISVSSYGHHFASFNFEDPNFNNREYETLMGYGQAKTANNLFIVEFDARSQSSGVRGYSLHPGSVNDTELGRMAPMELFRQLGTHDENGNIYPEVAKKLKTPQQGAATSVWCAVSEKLNEIGGVYCENCDVAEPDNGSVVQNYDDPLTLRGVMPYSLDKENARMLWQLSEELTGVTFDVV
jgi:NAD(P)-dependent dehydrogenase (short-subunit alcohol dehydrogenase family)